MNKIDQLLDFLSTPEIKDLFYQSDRSPQNSKFYAGQIQNKLKKLSQIQIEAHQELQTKLKQNEQLKQKLASSIRKSHANNKNFKQQFEKIKTQEVQNIVNIEQAKTNHQLKKREVSVLDLNLEQLNSQINSLMQSHFNSKEELQTLGNKIYDLQMEAEKQKQQDQTVIQEIQQLNVTHSQIQINVQQQKNNHQSLILRIKLCQQRKSELISNRNFQEQEKKKFQADIEKSTPKLEAKSYKSQELDALRDNIQGQLEDKNLVLDDIRKQTKILEDEFNTIPKFDKQIDVEKKAQKALLVERQILLAEFERVSKSSGIEEIQKKLQSSQISLQNPQENEEKLQSQYIVIQSQHGQILEIEQQLLNIEYQQDQIVQKRAQVLEEYQMLEKKMSQLGKGFIHLNSSMNNKSLVI